MRSTVTLRLESILPDRAAVLALQDMRPEEPVADRTARLYVQALELLRATGEPVALVADVSAREFARIHAGEGCNAPDSPVARILPRAEQLALFALTIGSRVSAEIDRRFAASDFALAAMLDATASASAERAVGEIERWLRGRVVDRAGAAPPVALAYPEAPVSPAPRESPAALVPPVALAYSPGYCGWDVTGQRALFAHLHPEEIGLRLNERCLMEPLKSVSGVILVGPAEIHDFAADFDFCHACRSRDCRERILRAKAARLPSQGAD